MSNVGFREGIYPLEKEDFCIRIVLQHCWQLRMSGNNQWIFLGKKYPRSIMYSKLCAFISTDPNIRGINKQQPYSRFKRNALENAIPKVQDRLGQPSSRLISLFVSRRLSPAHPAILKMWTTPLSTKKKIPNTNIFHSCRPQLRFAFKVVGKKQTFQTNDGFFMVIYHATIPQETPSTNPRLVTHHLLVESEQSSNDVA